MILHVPMSSGSLVRTNLILLHFVVFQEVFYMVGATLGLTERGERKLDAFLGPIIGE